MEPLKVTFNIHGWMVDQSHPLHLDAILAYVEADGMPHDELNLPVEKIKGVYKASAVMLNKQGIRNIYQARKYDLDVHIDGPKTFVKSKADDLDTASGPFKTCFFPVPIVYVTTAIAYCVGDKEKIKEILKLVNHLGSKRKLGYGEIKGVVVEPDDSANESWKLRILSSDLVKNFENKNDYILIYGNSSPPYWDKTRFKEVYIHKEIG